MLPKNISPKLQKIISNVGWLFSERIINMALSLLVGIYVIRYLGPTDYGKLSYSVGFIGLFGVVAKLGLDKIIVRNIVEEEQATSEILGTAFILKLISSIITIMIVTIIIWLFNEDLQIRWLTTIIAWGLMFESTEVIDFWFQSKVLSKPIATVKTLQVIITSVFKFLFVCWKLPVIAFAWLMLADVIFRAIGMIIAYSQHQKSYLRWQVNWTTARKLLHDSWPLILSSAMILIYMKIDQVMLGNMIGSKQVGNYAAAVRLSEIWYFMPIAICNSVFPSIIRFKQLCKQQYSRKLQQLYDLMAWMSFSIACFMTLSSGFLISVLLGEEYLTTGKILALHIWAGPFVFLGVAHSQWLTAENYTRFSFASTSLGAFTNVILNVYLIPQYGGIGAALATVIAYGVSSYVVCFFYPPMFESAWMLTKALLIPLRMRQNLIYLQSCKKILFDKT